MLPRTFSYRRLLVWGFIVIVVLMGIIRFAPLPLFRAQIAGNTPGYCCANLGAACEQMPQGQCPAGSVFVNGTTPANQTACNSICSGNGGAAGAGAGAAAAATQCSDGIDNDADGLVDGSDPGCLRNGALNALDDDESNPVCPPSYLFDIQSKIYAGGGQLFMGNDFNNGNRQLSSYYTDGLTCAPSENDWIPSGMQLESMQCIYSRGGTCFAAACLWRLPVSMSAGRVIGYPYPLTNGTLPYGKPVTYAFSTEMTGPAGHCTNPPGPGFQNVTFAALGCPVHLATNGDFGWTPDLIGCNQSLCLWAKEAPTASEIAINDCAAPPSPSHTLIQRQCAVNVGGCKAELCLWGKTVKTEVCVDALATTSARSNVNISSASRTGFSSSTASSSNRSASSASAASSSLRPAPVCGDGQVAGPEQCDDGNRNASDGCSSVCAVEDGWQCLPSVQANPASLSLCKPFCGDAIMVGPERCDDGNRVNGDGCSAVCQIEKGFQCTQPAGRIMAQAGNSIPSQQASARCQDDLDNDGDRRIDMADPGCGFPGDSDETDLPRNPSVCVAGSSSSRSSAGSSSSSSVRGGGSSSSFHRGPGCGDGIIQSPEQCDDGNGNTNDACTNGCFFTCSQGGLCPDGQSCPVNGICPSNCGNSRVDSDEECDLGSQNGQKGSGCTVGCQLEGCIPGTLCTNGLVCSDSGVCPRTVCGDGTKQGFEQCDDGNAVDTDACTNLCLIGNGGPCGNASQCQSELCIGGTCTACDTTDECPAGLLCLERRCVRNPVCGNGKPEFGESCDDGDTDDSDVCSNVCKKENNLPCDENTECASLLCVKGLCASCTSNAQCSGNKCLSGRCGDGCGDGQMNAGEACDAGGQNSDVLSDHCRLDCTRPACGDGVQDAGEQCDDGNDDNRDGCTVQCIKVQVQSDVSSGEIPDAGVECRSDEECPTGSWCINGTCVNLPLAAECTRNDQCASGMCLNGFCAPNQAQQASVTTGVSTPGGIRGDSGPAAIAVMGAGAAAGWAWVRKRRRLSH